jgi:hypothetical protein
MLIIRPTDGGDGTCHSISTNALPLLGNMKRLDASMLTAENLGACMVHDKRSADGSYGVIDTTATHRDETCKSRFAL